VKFTHGFGDQQLDSVVWYVTEFSRKLDCQDESQSWIRKGHNACLCGHGTCHLSIRNGSDTVDIDEAGPGDVLEVYILKIDIMQLADGNVGVRAIFLKAIFLKQ